MPLKIAVIGGGISGIAAFWALNDSENEVHIFEAQDHIGGHTQTVQWQDPESRSLKVPIDTAFALFNHGTYPSFCAFLSHLGLNTLPVRVTFGITRHGGKFEWSSRSLSGIFAQRRRLFSPRMWRLLFDIVRFNTFATDILDSEYPFKQDSIGAYLRRHDYSDTFVENYLVPLTSTLWITNPQELFSTTPAIMIIRYLWNHHMLNTFSDQLQWLSVRGGAQTYIDAVLAQTSTNNVHVSRKVSRIVSKGSKSVLEFEDGIQESFDRVILATHAPEAMQILGEGCGPEQHEILRHFRISRSSVVLHSDTSFMPTRRSAWSAWNYLDEQHINASEKNVSLTFYLNEMLGLDINDPATKNLGPIFTTLNPQRKPSQKTIQGTFQYAHPIYTTEVLRRQEQFDRIQGVNNIWFAGAWMKYGFHEDGFTAGLEAAKAICPTISLPFKVVDSKYSRGMRPGSPTLKERCRRGICHVLQFWILLFMRAWVMVGAFALVVNRPFRVKRRTSERDAERYNLETDHC